MLIIGCGNCDRGDDAAGVLVADGLRALGVPTKVCDGGFAELMEEWIGTAEVIIVDCVVTGSPLGTLHEWEGNCSLATAKCSGSTHGLGLGEAIELARALGRLPAKLLVYGIEGRSFAPGSAVSPEVSRAVESLVEKMADKLCNQWSCELVQRTR